jgi:hypothetical protein
MTILDSIIRNNAKWKLAEEKAKARREGFDAGFDAGRKAMQEQIKDTGRLGTTEDTHKTKCPHCTKDINIPCVNYVIAGLEKL